MLKELSRRCEVGENGGMACGPVFSTAVVSEMLVEEDGNRKYLTLCWVSEADDCVSFEVSEKPLAPYYLDLNYEADDENSLDAAKATVSEEYVSGDEEYEGLYKKQYEQLLKMLKDKMVEEELFDPKEDDWMF